VQLPIVLGLVALVLAVAALVVVLEDRRAAKRAALQRKARLARFGWVFGALLLTLLRGRSSTVDVQPARRRTRCS